MATHFKGPVISEQGFQVGSGSQISGILKGTASVVVGTNAAAAETDVAVVVPGVAVGDAVVMNPPLASAEAGLAVVLCWVSAANEVTLRLSNLNASDALVGSTSNWTYLVIKS